jgi:Protein of unknown function (DUF2752)
MISPRITANLLATLGVAGAALLYRFSPREYSFYPRCPFFAFTNHYCPGCGATRAIAELLHGHFVAALHFNAAVALLLPFALAYFATAYWTALRENRLEWPSAPSWSWKFAVTGVAVFGFTRMFMQGTL